MFNGFSKLGGATMIQHLFRATRLLLPTAAFAISSLAQERSPLDATYWGVVYDVPATRDVKVRADVPYSGALTADIYLPPGLKAGEKRPAASADRSGRGGLRHVEFQDSGRVTAGSQFNTTPASTEVQRDDQASNPGTTSPETSVNRKSRPECRYVSRS